MYKKIANANHEEVAGMTSRSTSRHGLSDGMAREKRIRNRAAKREEARLDLQERADELPLPADYEACGDCGYDHSYEPVEAHTAHGGVTH
jgi:hypothetical protein